MLLNLHSVTILSVSLPMTFILRSRLNNDGVCDGLYSAAAAAIQSTQPGVQNRRVAEKNKRERSVVCGNQTVIEKWQPL